MNNFILFKSINQGDAVKYLAALLLFSPLVFHRIFIGGYEQSYDDYAGFGLSAVGYLANISLVALPFLTRVNSSTRSFLYIWLFIVLISIFQLFNTYYLFKIDPFGLLTTTVRAMLWLAGITIYCSFFFNVRILVEAFIDIMTLAASIALFCYFFYLASDIPLGVNIDRGIGRLQGMFSEPSTLSAIFPGYVLLNLWQKNFKRAALGIIVIALTFSVICYATAVISLIIFVLHKFKKLISFSAYFITSFLILIIFSTGTNIADTADRTAQYLKDFFDIFWASGPIRQNTVDRIIDALASVSTYVTTTQVMEIKESGSLARLVGAVSLTENMYRDGTTWFGYGLSNYGYVTDKIYGTVLDFGLLPYLISSFGFPLGVILIFYHLYGILKWRSVSVAMFFVFICSYFGTIFNSAGGITAYTLPVLGLFSNYALHRQHSAKMGIEDFRQ